MNDFTKEELQIILLDMHTYINRAIMLAESPSHLNLRKKVESMIDNYCEHFKSQIDLDECPLRCMECFKVIA